MKVWLIYYALIGLMSVASALLFGAKLEWRLLIAFLCWPYFTYHGIKVAVPSFINTHKEE